ncbi:MAG: serine/threonine-protein kinase [Acidobacteriia bacterium]|nr:serine/threonine-protein kinase [Terriglobia bacterium]
MSLRAGEKLGPYEIVEPIGKGGMGEVYRAHDARLGRDVAIKVSSERFSERFEREARAVASLNHPNICTLHDVGPNYLVMELVEGETLAEHLKEGAVPLEESLRIARQIADALEAAHEKGIVHRDLKPGNVILKPDGSVKVLDFGLAKVGPRTASGGENVEDSPTISMAATRAGVILGTAAYMSPEQARGKTVDKRADIWAFGVVLCEMVTGSRLFQGEDLTETLASVVMKEPGLSDAPPQLRRLLKKCLQKDPKKRLRDIGDVWELMEDAPAPTQAAGEVRPAKAWLWPAVAAVAVVIAAGAAWLAWRSSRPVDHPLMRLSVDLGQEAARAPRLSLILSPDGTRIAYTGRHSGGTLQLYTRRLDQGVATVIPSSETTDPELFFSPDGEWIGFWGSSKLYKVSAQGGSPVTLGPSPEASLSVLGASWGDDNNIILGTINGLWRMPGSGGEPQPLAKGSGPQAFPQVLPGAKAVVFNSLNGVAPRTLDGLDIEALEFATGKRKILLHGGYSPHYLPTSPGTGYLIYKHEGTLFGVLFDPKRLELLGTPAPLLDDVAGSSTTTDGGGQFALSNTGTFAYLSGRTEGASYPMALLDAGGQTTPAVVQPGVYSAPRFSPDGKRLAYIASGSKGFDVWVYDLERHVSAQLTFQGTANREVAWARDSEHLVYGDGTALWWIRADGSGQAQLLVDKMANPRPGSIAPDGRLVFSPSTAGLPDIWTLPIDVSDPEHPKPGKAQPFLNDPSVVEVDPAFSPDGKYIAYSSNESGAEDIFVRPFPGPGGKWKVAAGKFPAWSPATHELLFLSRDDHIMAAAYSVQGDSFSSGAPRVWSPTQIRRNGVQGSFDVSPDGKRVAMFPGTEVEQPGSTLHATFLLNFFDEVRRRIPASGK